VNLAISSQLTAISQAIEKDSMQLAVGRQQEKFEFRNSKFECPHPGLRSFVTGQPVRAGSSKNSVKCSVLREVMRTELRGMNAMRHALCALRNQRGVFIVEVLVAGVVLAISVIGLVLMFSWGQSFVVAQGDDRVALYLAQQRIESLRASGYTAVEVLNSNCGGTPEADEDLTAGMANSQSFSRHTAVEHVNDDDITALECGTDTVRITVTVTANMPQSNPITLQTVLTNA